MGGVSSGGGDTTVNLIDNKFIGNTITNYYTWGIDLYQSEHGCKVLNNIFSPNQPTSRGSGIFMVHRIAIMISLMFHKTL